MKKLSVPWLAKWAAFTVVGLALGWGASLATDALSTHPTADELLRAQEQELTRLEEDLPPLRFERYPTEREARRKCQQHSYAIIVPDDGQPAYYLCSRIG